MASMNVGMIMKHNHKRVVIIKTGLSVDGSDAVMIARLGTGKPSGKAPYVEVKHWLNDYWIPLDEVSVVKTEAVVHAFTGPGRLPKGSLKAVLKKVDKISR